MKNQTDRVKIIIEALEQWFEDEPALNSAIEATVGAKLFARHDIEYSLDHIKRSVTRESLTAWCKNAGVEDKRIKKSDTVLCLHAGNLPLVGLQDLLAVLLSGKNYAGKISRKDPYLIPVFLEKLSEAGLKRKIKWSEDLDDFKNLAASQVLFSGSGDSVKKVREKIQELNAAAVEVRYLIRTADFSMAYLDDDKPENIAHLAEAMLRYEGKGCRSVALVVSPFNLDAVIEKLEGAVQRYWSENPENKTLTPKTRYRAAYNKVIGRNHYQIKHLLIQENGLEFDNDDIIYWVKGDLTKASQLAELHLRKLQNVYTLNSGVVLGGFEDRTAALENAQKPPIDWKPDSVDPLQWLISG